MENFWKWKNLEIAWQVEGQIQSSPIAIVLIHGFGASKEHWRFNQKVLSKLAPCYSLDLIGFGKSSQPISRLPYEKFTPNSFNYCFDEWSQQIVDFCTQIVQKPVILIGNSIGGVIALNASEKISTKCSKLILIDCAQRTMDDKRLYSQPLIMRFLRPVVKVIVRQRLITQVIFKNASNPTFIEKILKIAYPSKNNIDKELIDLLYKPSQRKGAQEAFRGFINLFDDHLAPNLLKSLSIPVHLICGENDPWEPIEEAKKWQSKFSCIKSLDIIMGAGHCPHDENPDKVNPILKKIIQEAM